MTRTIASFGILAVLAACGGKIETETVDQRTSDSPPGGADTPPPSPTPTFVPPPPPPDPDCGVRFGRDILARMDAAWGCTEASCHGGPIPVSSPLLDASDPKGTYVALLSYRMSDGRVYVDTTSFDPTTSGIHCQLRGECGEKMPVGITLSRNDLAVVDAWLACGAPYN